MKLKVKKLSPTGVIPTKAHPTDAGLDLTATSVHKVDEGEFGYIEYGTSLSIEMEPGFTGFLFPRSSVSKTGLILANSVGVIDQGYTGEIILRFKYIPNTKKYDIGDRVGQLVILATPDIELEEVTELEETERGSDGFGSSG